MKKTLVLLFAFALAVPAFANINTYGEIETIGYTQTTDAGSKSVANRVLFGVSSELTEDVRANLTFGYGNKWSNWSGDNVDGYLNSIRVSEANVVISNIFGALEAKIGRQYYGNEDSPVMYYGPRHNYYFNLGLGDSLDGALLTYNGEKLAFSAFYGQMTDMSDDRLTGLTLDYAFANNLTAGVYWYDYGLNYATLEHRGIWGGKLAYQNEGSKLAVEYAKNYENGVFSHNNVGWMLKADAALNIDTEVLALTPRITYLHTEKEFYAPGGYTAGIIFTNHFIGATWPVIKFLNAGIDFNFKSLEKFTFSFDYVNANEKEAPFGYLGNEYDLLVKYQHNDYVAFTLGGGILTNNSGTLFYDSGDICAAQMGMLIKF